MSWPVLTVVGLCLGCGCGGPKTTVHSQESRQKTVVQGPVEPTAEPVPPARTPRRVIVVAAEMPPGAQAVEGAVLRAMRKRGVGVQDATDDGPVDLVVTLTSATRSGGGWGGIPSYEVLLRYVLLDGRSRETIGTGVDSARYADPSSQRGILGALSKAAENVAGKLERAIASLPPAPPRPERPPTPPVESPQISIACLPFRNTTQDRRLDGWCESLAAVAAGEFKRQRKYRVVERARLGDIVDDSEIIRVIEGTAEAARSVGRKLGVDLLLVGEVAVRPDGNLSVSGRIVSANEAEVQQAVRVVGRAGDVDRLEQGLRTQLARPREPWVLQNLEQLERAPIAWPTQGPGR